MTTEHTPGPWYADDRGNIWRRPTAELYPEGATAGDQPLARALKGWHEAGRDPYPVEANAQLIAKAPELLEALALLRDAVHLGVPGAINEAWTAARDLLKELDR